MLAIVTGTPYNRAMADEPENLTLRLLQEIREEMREMRSDLSGQIKDLTQRVDGNTLTLNLIAGVVHDHEQRIETLEAR